MDTTPKPTPVPKELLYRASKTFKKSRPSVLVLLTARALTGHLSHSGRDDAGKTQRIDMRYMCTHVPQQRVEMSLVPESKDAKKERKKKEKKAERRPKAMAETRMRPVPRARVDMLVNMLVRVLREGLPSETAGTEKKSPEQQKKKSQGLDELLQTKLQDLKPKPAPSEGAWLREKLRDLLPRGAALKPHEAEWFSGKLMRAGSVCGSSGSSITLVGETEKEKASGAVTPTKISLVEEAVDEVRDTEARLLAAAHPAVRLASEWLEYDAEVTLTLLDALQMRLRKEEHAAYRRFRIYQSCHDRFWNYMNAEEREECQQRQMRYLDAKMMTATMNWAVLVARKEGTLENEQVKQDRTEWRQRWTKHGDGKKKTG